jgi:peptide/nickel transport system substrate-binding protein
MGSCASRELVLWSGDLILRGMQNDLSQAVTTADVVPSLRRWMGRDLVGAKIQAVLVSIDPVDQRTFELKLNKPYPNLLLSLGSGGGEIPVIMRAKDLDGDPAKPVVTAIGSAPFRFNHDAHVSGALTVFDRNPDYMPRSELADGLSGGRVVKVDRVEWRVIPDAATAAAALQNGEVDIWEQPAPDLVPLLSQSQTLGVRVERALRPPRDDHHSRFRHHPYYFGLSSTVRFRSSP